MSVVKPEKKQKFDGLIFRMNSDDSRFIVMRGDYPAEQILKVALEEAHIDREDKEGWEKARYFQSWFKASPLGRQQGYSSWSHPRDTPCRGAYFASVLC